MRSWELEHLETTVCEFPKHRGDGWVEVIQKDREYVEWLLVNIEDMDDDLRDALRWGVSNIPDRL